MTFVIVIDLMNSFYQRREHQSANTEHILSAAIITAGNEKYRNLLRKFILLRFHHSNENETSIGKGLYNPCWCNIRGSTTEEIMRTDNMTKPKPKSNPKPNPIPACNPH